MPHEVTHLTMRDGLIPFLIGILVVNVPTFLSDQSIWQRIGAAQDEKTVSKGFWLSVFNSILTWGSIVTLACFVFIIIAPKPNENPLFTLMHTLGSLGTVGRVVIFFTVLGLFGAMLSTSSTQLIATSHAIYEDIFSNSRKKALEIRLEDKKELRLSRTVLIISAIFAALVVGVLNYMGFSIADLVFSIYGSQLGLVPLVLFALLMTNRRIRHLRNWAAAAVVTGFVSGWGSAILGKITGNDNLVFLAPCVSLALSSGVLLIGYLTRRAYADLG